MVLVLEADRYDDYLKYIHDILVETQLYVMELTELFYKNKNRIEIINASAPIVFTLCEIAFVEAVIMRISKLTDRASTINSSNLTIKTLFEHFVPEVLY